MEKDEVKAYVMQSLFLLMKNVPYEKVTMSMVANKAGVSRRTVYRYFENKKMILCEYFDNLISLYRKKLQENMDKGNIVLSSFQFIFDNSEVFIIAYKNGLLGSISSAIVDIVREIVLARHQESKSWSKEYTDYYVSFVAGGIYRIFYEWLKKDSNKKPNEMFEIYKNVISDLDKRISNI